MPRKPQRPTRGQKGKDRKRPRQFHRGAAQGHINEKTMKREVNPAYAKADADQQAVEETTKTHRATTRDWQDCLDQLDRTSPHVPTWKVAI